MRDDVYAVHRTYVQKYKVSDIKAAAAAAALRPHETGRGGDATLLHRGRTAGEGGGGAVTRSVSAAGLPDGPDPGATWTRLDRLTRRIVGRRMERGSTPATDEALDRLMVLRACDGAAGGELNDSA